MVAQTRLNVNVLHTFPLLLLCSDVNNPFLKFVHSFYIRPVYLFSCPYSTVYAVTNNIQSKQLHTHNVFAKPRL